MFYRLGCTRGNQPVLRYGNTNNNLGGLDYSRMLSYPAIDVVYTWVNGSDPRWMEKKLLWGIRLGKINATVSSSSAGKNGANESSEVEAEDDAISQNRYRDSDELRYSLRSLEKYAPWIRRVYLVTDNQIPSWLDLSYDRIKMISHTDIFPNRSHLPVFSSPAIETHLHRIPGLSKKFIYFNDDVFLGSPVLPEDFYSLSNSQKLRFAWDVPKCAPGCSDAWIGDGFCDKACNVSSCNFDFPDCINGSNVKDKSTVDKKIPSASVVCNVGCPNNWLGDRVCDVRCDNQDCAWDVGDCGFSRIVGAFPGVTISPTMVTVENTSPSANTSVLLPQAPVLLIIPSLKAKAFYINMSKVFDFGGRETEFTDVSYTELLDTTDILFELSSEQSVHYVALSKKTGFMTVLLFHGQEDTPKQNMIPHDIYFTVTAKGIGNSTAGEENIQLLKSVSFRVRIVEDSTKSYAQRLQPSHMGRIESYSNAVSSESLPCKIKILPTPFSSAYAGCVRDKNFPLKARGLDFRPDLQAVVLQMYVPHASVISSTYLGQLNLHAKLTLLNGSVAIVDRPFCSSLAFYSSNSVIELYENAHCDSMNISSVPVGLNSAEVPQKEDLFRGAFIYSEISSLDPEEFDFVDYYALKRHNTRVTEGAAVTPLSLNDDILVILPVPFKWSTVEPTWITAAVDIELSSETSTENQSVLSLTAAFSWGGKNASKNITESEEIDDLWFQSIDDFNIDDSAERSWTRRQLRHSDRLVQFTKAQHMFASAIEADSYRQNRRAKRHRRLEDTYAASLQHVNRILNREFGSENRKVPAHMPHMIDVDIMHEMQHRWEALWNATSSHRFRSTSDMQYAFAYYHYVMNRYSAHPPDPAAFLADEIDTNGDGFIDNNEFRTLAAIVNAKILTPEKIQSFKDCAFPTIREESSVRQTAGSEIEEHLTIKAPRTIKSILNCSIISTALADRFKTSRYPLIPPTYTVGAEEDVVFEMIYDNATLTTEKLDSVRWRKSKFICLNDNVNQYTPELAETVRDFFEAMYPIPSRFELPRGKTNPTLYTDEYTIKWNTNTDFDAVSSLDLSTLDFYLDKAVLYIIDAESVFNEIKLHPYLVPIIICIAIIFFVVLSWISGKVSSEHRETRGNDTISRQDEYTQDNNGGVDLETDASSQRERSTPSRKYVRKEKKP